MQDPRRVYVDYDDVLCETARGLIALLRSQFAKSVAYEEVTSFDLSVSFELSQDEFSRFMHLAHEPKEILTLEPVPGAKEALDELTALGYEIVVITGRPPSASAPSAAWLENHQIPYHQLLFVDKYRRVQLNASHRTAVTLDDMREMRFCFAVEDSWDMAEYLAEDMALPVALLDRPWNRAAAAKKRQAAGRSGRTTDRCAAAPDEDLCGGDPRPAEAVPSQAGGQGHGPHRRRGPSGQSAAGYS